MPKAATLLTCLSCFGIAGCGGGSPASPSPPTELPPTPILMHVHDGNGRLAIVNAETGVTQIVGDTNQPLTDIAFDNAGRLFGVTFSHLFAIDPTTARATFIGTHFVPGANALEAGTNGTLLAAGDSSDGLYSINTQTGRGTLLGRMGYRSGGDLAFNRSTLYMASSQGLLVQVDTASPSRSRAIGNLGVASMFGLATGSDGRLYGSADIRMYVVDTSTGVALRPVTFGTSGLGVSYGQAFRR